MADKLTNGTLLGLGAGVAAALIPQVQEVVMDLLPTQYSETIFVVLGFAGVGALIGLIMDKY